MIAIFFVTSAIIIFEMLYNWTINEISVRQPQNTQNICINFCISSIYALSL